jgi:hypothetical protein
VSQFEQHEDATSERGERLVPKTGNRHRIGPANAKPVGNRATGSRKNGNGGSVEIAVDSILQDLLFQDGARITADPARQSRKSPVFG